MLVAAGPKMCKTLLCGIEMPIALASGTPFLGTFAVRRRARVAVLSAESGMPTIREVAQQAARAHGFSLGSLGDWLTFSDQVPLLSRPEDLAGLEKYIDQHGSEVLVLDPVFMMLAGVNQASLVSVGQVVGELAKLCQKRAVTPVLIHHLTRAAGKSSAPPRLTDLTGAGFSEFMRAWILLGRRERYRPGSGLHRLHLTLGGSAGHSSAWNVTLFEGHQGAREWKVTVKPIGGTGRPAGHVKRLAKVMYCWLKDRGDQGDTSRGVRDGTGLKTAEAKRALDWLVEHGKVASCLVQKSNRKKPYQGYKVAVGKSLGSSYGDNGGATGKVGPGGCVRLWGEKCVCVAHTFPHSSTPPRAASFLDGCLMMSLSKKKARPATRRRKAAPPHLQLSPARPRPEPPPCPSRDHSGPQAGEVRTEYKPVPERAVANGATPVSLRIQFDEDGLQPLVSLAAAEALERLKTERAKLQVLLDCTESRRSGNAPAGVEACQPIRPTASPGPPLVPRLPPYYNCRYQLTQYTTTNTTREYHSNTPITTPIYTTHINHTIFPAAGGGG